MGDVSGLIADPQFQSLPPADQRTALIGVSGDKTFGTLNDADTGQFIQRLQAKNTSPAAQNYDAFLASGQPTRAVRPVLKGSQTFSERIGERVGQNVSLVPHAISAINQNDAIMAKVKAGADLTPEERTLYTEFMSPQAHAGTQQLVGHGVTGALTIGPRLAYNTVKNYIENPAAAAGDIVTASPELAEMKLPANKVWSRGSAVPTPPPELALSPEQQAQYTKNLDAANASYQEKAQKYAGAVTNTFDTAARQHADALAAHEQNIQAIQQQHAADLAKAQADFEAGTQKEQALRAAHEQKVQAAQQSREQAAAVEQQRSELGDTQSALIEQTRQKAQAVAQQQRASLDARWDDLRDKVGEETPTPITDAVRALDKAETKILRGAHGTLKQFKQMLSEFGFGSIDPETGEYISGSPDAPWQTVRAQASAMSRAMASGDLGPIYPALKLVRDALEDSAGKVATAKGLGNEYQALRSDEHLYRSDFEKLGPVQLGKGNPAARLVRAPNATYARDQIMGKGSDLLGQALSRWDKSGDLAGNVTRIHEIEKQIKSLPKVKVLPEPPAYTGQAPTMAQVPEPTLPARPGVPEGRLPAQFTHPTQGVPVAPELERVPKPVPEPPPAPKAGFFRKHVIPKAGGVAAATMNVPIPGHTLLNYGIGSEGARWVANKVASRARPMPPSPEAYHRTILAAKEGSIPPGEADRQIARSGGSVKVRPPFWRRMPPPPKQ